MVANVTVSPKFQISIPKEVREAFGISAGEELTWFDDGGTLTLVRTRSFDELGGFLARRGHTGIDIDPNELRDKQDREF